MVGCLREHVLTLVVVADGVMFPCTRRKSKRGNKAPSRTVGDLEYMLEKLRMETGGEGPEWEVKSRVLQDSIHLAEEEEARLQAENLRMQQQLDKMAADPEVRALLAARAAVSAVNPHALLPC